jgi:SAM-dependent MidA family methyltransferase
MLELLLRQEIQEKGPLSQSRFMELALQHPTHGYYRSQKGVAQDFTTSPEISQVFGEFMGAWAIDYYEKLEKPPAVSLIELGPGRGTLMADILRIAKVSKPFLEALNIHLVEINPLLKSLQKQKISHGPTWFERFEDIPRSEYPFILIANEFFDALPSDCFVRKDHVLYERRIGIQQGKLAFILQALRQDQDPNQTWEESPQAESLLNEICSRLLEQKGVFLCIDYGYEKGTGESLQALFKEHPSDPLCHVGLSDLSCHVPFGRLKEMALARGLEVVGPIPQGQFLKNLGFDIRIEMLKNKNPSQKASLDAAAIRLTHPQQMGNLFKAMAIFSPGSMKPSGFES